MIVNKPGHMTKMATINIYGQMNRIFIKLKKKLNPGHVLTLSWGYIHLYDLYIQTCLLVHVYVSDLR